MLLDLDIKIKRWVVTGFVLTIACISVCLNPAYASPTVPASVVIQATRELNRGDQIGLIHARIIVSKIFTTHDDRRGFFVTHIPTPEWLPKPTYLGQTTLRYLAEALMNYAMMSAKNKDWRSFGLSFQLLTDIADRLTTLKPPARLKDNTGVVETASQMSTWTYFAISGGINAESYMIQSVIHSQANAPSCLGLLASRLREMDRMRNARLSLKDNLLYQQTIHRKIQQMRPTLAAAVKCLESGHDHTKNTHTFSRTKQPHQI